MVQLFRISANNSFKWLSCLLMLFPVLSYGQDTITRNLSVNGYVTDMPSIMFQKLNGDWTVDNIIHNRLNFKWHNTANSLIAEFELRNRIFTGEPVKDNPDYANLIAADNGYFNLSDNISTGKSYIFNSKIDRAYIDYTADKFQLRIGRQRINWGQCFTWNPNDIFNTYSFFDFDYVEKPGSDAIRLQYYSTNTSDLEFAVKADNNHKVTSAVLYHFNKWDYDIQFLGGIMNDQDFVVGTGWSGNIKGASFTGEISYFYPKQNFADSSGLLVVSLGTEYTFKNSFTLQFEVLYDKNKSSGLVVLSIFTT